MSLFLHNDPLEMKGSKTIKDRKNLLSKLERIYCVSEFIKKKLHNSSHKNKMNIPINIFHQNRVIPNHPSTPNELC